MDLKNRSAVIEVQGTKFQTLYVGDVLDEYVTGKIPSDLRLPTGKEWTKFKMAGHHGFNDIRHGLPGVLAVHGGFVLTVVC